MFSFQGSGKLFKAIFGGEFVVNEKNTTGLQISASLFHCKNYICIIFDRNVRCDSFTNSSGHAVLKIFGPRKFFAFHFNF
jgi:hypothetical protein